MASLDTNNVGYMIENLLYKQTRYIVVFTPYGRLVQQNAVHCFDQLEYSLWQG